MCKLISKCCVCGRVYGITTKGQSTTNEIVSHGYCSNDCTNHTAVQITVWMDKYNMFVFERAYVVNEKMFFNGEFQQAYITININSRQGSLEAWDEQLGFYEETCCHNLPEERKDKMVTLKKWARDMNLIIKI